MAPIPAPRVSPFDWDTAIVRHNRRVIVALLARGIPIDRAKEIAQETWTRLMQKHRSGELDEVTLPGLAITQALFLAKDDARRVRRRPQAAMPADLRDGHASPESVVSSQEQAKIALLALQRLSENARRVFELAYDDPQLTHREIGNKLALSEQRVRQILCEVRKALRDALEVIS
jgi:RNA polymerase sigma factor (sigma-70 family)